jgi:drug/metabolite transporter (DMT)-like permease
MRLAPWALLSVALSWGLAFVVMKDSLERQNVNSFLFTRFVLAVLVMLAIRPSVIKLLNKDLLIRGSLTGLFLGSGYILQTIGLDLTSIAVTGFITGLYVVATPLIARIVFGEKLSGLTWGCVGLATVGLALLSLNGWSIGLGEFLVLLSAFAYGGHIIALSKWSPGRDAYAMTIVQLFVAGVMSAIACIFEGGYQAPPDWGVWGSIAFTAIICTAAAFIIQTWAQAHMNHTKVAIILTMEIVFAALFAVIFRGEILTARIALGGLLVMIAMYVLVLREP